jgi:hypothetical protein
MSYQQGLFKFRREHGIETFLGPIVTNVLRDIVEAREAHLGGDTIRFIEELTDICVLCENALAQTQSPEQRLDFIIRDINVDKILYEITIDIARYDRDQSPHIFRHIIRKLQLLIEFMGFDFNKCMVENIKKINSYKGKLNPRTGIWERSITQDQYEIYTPNFKACKVI